MQRTHLQTTHGEEMILPSSSGCRRWTAPHPTCSDREPLSAFPTGRWEVSALWFGRADTLDAWRMRGAVCMRVHFQDLLECPMCSFPPENISAGKKARTLSMLFDRIGPGGAPRRKSHLTYPCFWQGPARSLPRVGAQVLDGALWEK